MKVCKRFQWDSAHKLLLPYESKCQNLHGHTYFIEIEVEGKLNKEGMVMDFAQLKEAVNEVSFDHKALNDIICPKCGEKVFEGCMGDINPTAENMVKFLKKKLDEIWNSSWPRISRIRIWETPNSWAEEVW